MDWIVEDLKIAGVSTVATALAWLALNGAPAHAADVVFSSGQQLQQGSTLPEGKQNLPSGLTQLRLDDGTTVSIVGPATYSVGADGQLSVESGSFTAFAAPGANPMPILAGDTTLTLTAGSAANGKVAGDGSFSGFALAGSISLAAGGGGQSFSNGSSFQVDAGGTPRRVATAGVQPNGGINIYQQLLQKQKQIVQYLTNATPGSPLSTSFQGISLNQNPAPGTPTSLFTPTQIGRLQNALYGNNGGNNGGYPIGSFADLLALIASGGTIPPGDATVQSLLDMLTVLPPGVDIDLIREALLLAGYELPDVLVDNGGNNGGNNGGGTIPDPVLIGSGDGTEPPDGDGNITIAYSRIADDGLYQNAVIDRDDDGRFSGFRSSSGFQQIETGEDTFGHERYVGEYGGDAGVVGIARVVGGSGVGAIERGPNSGNHYVWGLPLINRPTSGILSYDLIAATSPTIRDGSVAPGTFTGDMAVSFGPSDIFWGLDANVSIGGSSYDVESTGGTAAPSLRVYSDGRFDDGEIDIADQGIACNQGNCRFAYNGFLSGNGGSHAGLAYTIRDDRSNNVTKWVDGAAAFKATGTSGGGSTDPVIAVENGQYFEIAGSRATFGIGEVTYSDGLPKKLNDPNAFAQATSAKLVGGDFTDNMAWTRWTDGTVRVQNNYYTLSPDQTIHVLAGTPTLTMPTSGRLDYDLIATTPLTVEGQAQTGTITGDMAIALGATPRVGLEMGIAYGAMGWNVSTTGGVANPEQSEVQLRYESYMDMGYKFGATFGQTALVPVINSSGGACSQSCGVSVVGNLFGANAEDVGAIVKVADRNTNNVTTEFTGLALFGNGSRSDGGGGNSGGVTGTVRSDQYLAYAAGEGIGIDNRSPRPNQDPPLPLDVTYSASGAPIGYEWTTNESPNIGSASEHESGSVGDTIGWTRWAEGTTAGSFYSDSAKTFGANQGWHIVAGAPVTNAPTSGTATYLLAGATAPTIRDGSLAPGSFTGDLAIAFGANPMAGFDFDVTIGGSSYGFGTAGGAADPTNGGRPIETSGNFAWTFGANNLDVSGSGGGCNSGGACAGMRGFLAGDGANAVGVSYTFGGGSLSANVDGVAAFTSNAP